MSELKTHMMAKGVWTLCRIDASRYSKISMTSIANHVDCRNCLRIMHKSSMPKDAIPDKWTKDEVQQMVYRRKIKQDIIPPDDEQPIGYTVQQNMLYRKGIKIEEIISNGQTKYHQFRCEICNIYSDWLSNVGQLKKFISNHPHAIPVPEKNDITATVDNGRFIAPEKFDGLHLNMKDITTKQSILTPDGKWFNNMPVDWHMHLLDATNSGDRKYGCNYCLKSSEWLHNKEQLHDFMQYHLHCQKEYAGQQRKADITATDALKVTVPPSIDKDVHNIITKDDRTVGCDGTGTVYMDTLTPSMVDDVKKGLDAVLDGCYIHNQPFGKHTGKFCICKKCHKYTNWTSDINELIYWYFDHICEASDLKVVAGTHPWDIAPQNTAVDLKDAIPPQMFMDDTPSHTIREYEITKEMLGDIKDVNGSGHVDGGEPVSITMDGVKLTEEQASKIPINNPALDDVKKMILDNIPLHFQWKDDSKDELKKVIPPSNFKKSIHFNGMVFNFVVIPCKKMVKGWVDKVPVFYVRDQGGRFEATVTTDEMDTFYPLMGISLCMLKLINKICNLSFKRNSPKQMSWHDLKDYLNNEVTQRKVQE
jgi:hypothetical protein